MRGIMEKPKAPLSIASPEKSDYWEVRRMILDAIRDQDDELILALRANHPKIFQNVVNQARNAQSKWFH